MRFKTPMNGYCYPATSINSDCKFYAYKEYSFLNLLQMNKSKCVQHKILVNNQNKPILNIQYHNYRSKAKAALFVTHLMSCYEFHLLHLLIFIAINV